MPSKSYSFLVTLYLSLALLFTLFQSGFQTIFNLKIIILNITGKSLSEALIFASTNPLYDDRLFIVHENCKLRIPTEHVVYTNCCFCFDIQNISGTQHVLQMFRASEKDLPLLIMKTQLYNGTSIHPHHKPS